jgi:pimeloyl-ACP methyl ester carboxylesterase
MENNKNKDSAVINNHPWLDREEYPFQSRYFKINGHRLHYIDEGEGDVLLFVHGTPSWSFDYRNVIKQLVGSHRCIAFDHMGFGLSDKPAHYDYSTINHSKTLESFIISMQLEGITLGVHDFGGPIALNFAIQHPDKVKKLVILNSWLWSSSSDPDFQRFRKILKSPLLPFLYRYLNFSPRYILPKSFGAKKINRKILSHYTKPFANSGQRYGTVAFAKSLLNDQDWFESLWNRKESITSKPTLFIWGMQDQFIKPHFLNKFLSGFPNAQVLKLDPCGHFPQEEEPEIMANAIAAFIFEF